MALAMNKNQESFVKYNEPPWCVGQDRVDILSPGAAEGSDYKLDLRGWARGEEVPKKVQQKPGPSAVYETR